MMALRATVFFTALTLVSPYNAAQQTAGKKLDLEKLTSRAQQGYVQDQLQLALAFRTGEGVPRDLVTAAYWFTKAADQGNPPAQANLAYLYLAGLGVPRDGKQAFKWFQGQRQKIMRRPSLVWPTWRCPG